MRALRIKLQGGADGRWYVSHFGSKIHSFNSRADAEVFAKRWAQVNQPSVVSVEVEGKEQETWTFGEATPGIKRAGHP